MTQKSKPLSKMPKPDRLLSKEAKRVWTETGNNLIRDGYLRGSELDTFRIYCYYDARWRELANRSNSEGLWITGPRGGLRVNPIHKELLRLCRILLRLSMQFGMTPLSRRRIYDRAVKLKINR